MDEETLLHTAIGLIAEKKGAGIVAIDLRDASIPTSYFLITEADNPVQIKAIVSNLKEKLPCRALHREGLSERRWVVVDYGGIVIHVLRYRIALGGSHHRSRNPLCETAEP